MGIIAWIIMGLVAGTVAKMIMKEGGGWLSSILFGIIGGVVGGFLGSAIFDNGRMSLTSIWSWVLAIVGACLVIWIYSLVSRGKARS